ncbi:hypothetical protein PG993_006893 [Apiospora rasikravindrae]|uniref:Uncharacterized protein n=1 Tax=Apiospora rasikravindrae TaxID=990691 RepID=A0ABR1SW81_9PEZI
MLPPPGGWEAINRDNLVKLQENGRYINGLTDNVLKLMRHIPYFSQNSPELLFETHPVAHDEKFTGSFARSPETDEEKEAAQERIRKAHEDFDQLVPPHMLLFATGRPWRCYTILIDTERGAVRFWDRAGDHYPTQHPGDLDLDSNLDEEEISLDSAEAWKLARIYKIQTFFALWKREFMVNSSPHCFQSTVWRGVNLI